jgi:GTPase SAR1 family protein
LVYDITDGKSFHNLDYWFEELNERLMSNEIVISVVGNKTDLTKKRSVSQEAG